MSSRDRTVRIIVGIAFLLLAITNNVGFFGLFGQVLVGLIGAALLASAWLQFCFLYTILGRDGDGDGDGTSPPEDDDSRFQG
ncbi:YgaP family membrane protein [Phaeovibrio sulfidiphilus]|nr:DUF2892 domain-containing protein [Phaeovibrio sulfidiphilus]